MATVGSLGPSGGAGVYDLLGFSTSTDLDPSAPLSAIDLRALIDRMNVRSDLIKYRVSHCIKEHYHEFEGVISRAGNAVSQFEGISKELEGTLGLFGTSGFTQETGNREIPIDVELCELVGDMRKIRVEVENKRKALAIVERISSLHKQLVGVEEDISQRQFIQAAEALCGLRKALGIPSSWRGGEEFTNEDQAAKVLMFLRNSWVTCFHKMQIFLNELLEKMVVLDEENSKLYISHCLTSETSSCGMQLDAAPAALLTSMDAILTSMDKMGIVDTAFAKLADGVFKTVISAILDDPVKVEITEELVPSNDQAGRVFLSWALNVGSQENMALMNLYTKLLKVVKFLSQHLCCGNDTWTMLLGRMIWPRLAEAIITGYLSKAVPNEMSEVSQFQQLASLTKEFELAISSVNFIPQLGSEGDNLGRFATNVDIHFASKKKNRILARARRLLVRSDFSLSLNKNMGSPSRGSRSGSRQNPSGEHSLELLFQQETCTVSWAAKELVQIVIETLEDCCISTLRTAVELYHAARDTILLYRAIVPVKLAKELNSLSQEAVIFHNDCLYLANEVLGLAYQYRDAAVGNLKETFVFVDLAPLFRQMAGEVLKQQIRTIKSGLDEALDQANGFRNTNKKQHNENASLALDQVIFLLEKVRMVWQPLMPPSIYIKSLGFLMNITFERVVSEILALDDMDIAETVQLRNLIFFLDESLSSQLQSLVGEFDQQQVRNDKHSSPWSQKDELLPAWCKLMRLAELLDMSLISITQAWESGNLAVCGFSSSEVQKLIKAVFSDTDLRKESLRRITASQFF